MVSSRRVRKARTVKGSKGAFTLIELLVVIAIIAILAGIILAVFSRARLSAWQAQEVNNLSNYATAMTLYKDDFGGYPLGSLQGNVVNLPDLGGNPPGGATYATYDVANARKTRINALFPSFVDEQSLIISPKENLQSTLATTTLNTRPVGDALTVGTTDGGGNYSSSSYDDHYNVFGYNADGTPIIDPAAQVAGGRKAKRLNNRFAPGDTVITVSRELAIQYDGPNEVVPIVRLGGDTDKVVFSNFNWTTQ